MKNKNFYELCNNCKSLLLDNDESGFKEYLKNNLRITKQSYFPKHGIEPKQLKLLDKYDLFNFFSKVLESEEDRQIRLYKAAILAYLLQTRTDIKYICEVLSFDINKADSGLKIARKHIILDRERVAIADYELKLENIKYVETKISDIEKLINDNNDAKDEEIKTQKKKFKEDVYKLLIGKTVEKKASTKNKKFAIGHIITKEDLDHLVKFKYNIGVFIKEHLNLDIYQDYSVCANTLKDFKESIASQKTSFNKIYWNDLHEYRERLRHLTSNLYLFYSL